MIDNISQDIYWVTLTIIMTSLLWVPHILYSIFKNGIIKAVSFPDAAALQATNWAKRAKAAHKNAAENLVIFAPLTILVTLLEANNDMTALAAVAYFFVRALHFIAHVIGVPVMRTLLFLAGVACQIAMATALLNAI